MAKNWIQHDDPVEYTAPVGGVVTGTVYLIGTVLVLANFTAAAAAKFTGTTRGVISYAKAGSQAWTEGAAVYWDDSAKVFTTTSSGNTKAGTAYEAVGAGAGLTTGKIRLNGIGT